MSNELIPENEFQTAVPSSDGLLTLRSTNTESPSNNDLLNTYDLITEPDLIDVPHEHLETDNELITETNPVEGIPVILYTQGTCFENLSSDALITDKDELFIYLCDVLIRFDESPNHYQKEDYEALIRMLVGTLVYLYQRDAEIDLTKYVEKAGDIMTGFLTLSGAPIEDLHAATKKYVDDVIALLTINVNSRVKKSGDTMTGPLTLSGNPTQPLHAAPKQYVDSNLTTKVSKSGDTMTGPLVLPGAPTQNLQASTKKYVDDTFDQVYINWDQKVDVTGDTMTGELTMQDTGVKTDYVQFDTEATPDLFPGRRRWNNKFGTTELSLKGGNVTLQDGQELTIIVYNATETDFVDGQALTIVGSYDDIDQVELAIASDHENPKYRVNGIATEIIPAGGFGFMTYFGRVHNLDLTHFNVGDEVYLSQTVPGDLVKLEELAVNGRFCQIGKVLDNSANGILRLNIMNEPAVAHNTLGELNIFTANDTSTGVFQFGGITLQSPTTFNIGPAKGWIVDNESDPLKPSITYVEYAGANNISTPYINTSYVTYILLNIDGEIELQNTFPTPQERRSKIFLGKVGHGNKIAITVIFNATDYTISPLSQLRDMFTPMPLINDGIYPYADSNLNFNLTTGNLFGLGINFYNDVTNPNRITVFGGTAYTFMYRTQLGGGIAPRTTIDPLHYDLNGVITPIGSPAKQATNQRVYLLQSGEIRIQYGQIIHIDLTTAISAAANEAFNPFPPLRQDAILIGIISLRSDATNLADPTQARILLVSKFGETVGAAGGISTATLQKAYDNSPEPEIITNDILKAVTYKRGSASDSDNLIELKNGTDTIVGQMNAMGWATFEKFIKNGGLPTQFLKADGSIDDNDYATKTLALAYAIAL